VDNLETLDDVLRRAVRGCGESIHRLGMRSMVGSNSLSAFMNGRKSLTLMNATRLCKALGLWLAPTGAGDKAA
jgi:hypothetical protein